MSRFTRLARTATAMVVLAASAACYANGDADRGSALLILTAVVLAIGARP